MDPPVAGVPNASSSRTTYRVAARPCRLDSGEKPSVPTIASNDDRQNRQAVRRLGSDTAAPGGEPEFSCKRSSSQACTSHPATTYQARNRDESNAWHLQATSDGRWYGPG